MASNNSQKPPSIELQERDIWILEDTAKLRFVRATDMAKLHFDGSTDAAAVGSRQFRGNKRRPWHARGLEEKAKSIAPNRNSATRGNLPLGLPETD